jgi:hypothetical protein
VFAVWVLQAACAWVCVCVCCSTPGTQPRPANTRACTHTQKASVEGSPGALALLGNAWLERHKDVVEAWGAAYHDATWMPLVALLQVRWGVFVCALLVWLRVRLCLLHLCTHAHSDTATHACACMRVCSCAHAQAEPPSDGARLRQVLKDTFSRFNAAIEGCACAGVACSWRQLRASMRVFAWPVCVRTALSRPVPHCQQH